MSTPQAVGPGSVIGSRYEILNQLGAGGMGLVFKAHDRALDETVAVKILRPEASSDRGLAARLRSEVKLAWKVRHRNVCGIHEYGEDGELIFVSMEYIEGNDLRQIIRSSPGLDWARAYDVVVQVAEGLQAIHDAGVIHRDLKPANVMVDANGLVRLMDFGIAKSWGDEAGPSATGTGWVVGSPEYMSPEQVRARKIDFRADIYSLGVLIYEVFTGRVPFRGESPVATMLLHVEAAPPFDSREARRIPRALLPVLEKALAKDAADRHASCQEMLGALRQARAAYVEQATDEVASEAALPAAAVTAQPGASAAFKYLVPSLARALGNEAEDIRLEAVEALRRAPDVSPALPALLRALRDASPGVRAGAASALGGTATDKGLVVQALAAIQTDPDERVRRAVTAALQRLGAAAVPGGPSEAPTGPLGVDVLPEPVAIRDPPAEAEPAASVESAQDPSLAAASPSRDARDTEHAPPLPDPMTAPAPAVPPQPPWEAEPVVAVEAVDQRPAQPAPRPLEPRAAPALAVLPQPSVEPRAVAAVVESLKTHRPPGPLGRVEPDGPRPATERPRVIERPLFGQMRLEAGRPQRRMAAALVIVFGLAAPALWWALRPSLPAPEPPLLPAPQTTIASAPSTPEPAASPGAAVAIPSPSTSPLAQRARLQGATIQPTALSRSPSPSTAAPVTVSSSPPASPPPSVDADAGAIEARVPDPQRPTAAPPMADSPPPPATSPSAAPPPASPTLRGSLVMPGPGVTLPVCRRCPAPAYPSMAARLGTTAVVELRLLVDEMGAVLETEVLSGPQQFAKAAEQAAARWRYVPASKDGVPVKMWLLVPIRFVP